jgi:ubiquinone/menaquinone biosynthesis C-methylase UbiE
MPGEAMTDEKVAAFAALAELYDRYLVALNFAPYAEVVADRANGLSPRRVLETAAGTGVVTEVLSRTLPSDVATTTTDINLPMMERGKARPGMERVDEPTIRADLAAAGAASFESCVSRG